MSCAPPDMVVPTACCSCAALDEDSMSEMTCCNEKTRKSEWLMPLIGRVVVEVNEEEVISRRSVVRICCRNPDRATKLAHSFAPKMPPSNTNANLHYQTNSFDQPTRDSTFQPAHVFEMHLSARASVLGRNPALAGPSISSPL